MSLRGSQVVCQCSDIGGLLCCLTRATEEDYKTTQSQNILQMAVIFTTTKPGMVRSCLLCLSCPKLGMDGVCVLVAG